MKKLLLALSMLAGCSVPGCAHIGDAHRESVSDKVLDSTVLIKTNTGHGSGFAVTPSTIVTAFHVVQGGEIASVTTRDGQLCHVEDVVVSIEHDLAALRVKDCDIEPLKIRKDPMVEGARVHVAGNPGQLRWSITEGHVMDADEDDLVIDAVGLPGMSGGPVTDKNGDVVGVTVRVHASMGMRRNFTWGGYTMAEPVANLHRFVFP